ncbi:MAG: methylisocitrate lyase [Planctomycetota bacterium]
MKPGEKFRLAIEQEHPLQIVGTINAYCARLAEEAGFLAIYLSGAGVANASWGMPDLGMTSMTDVLQDAERILSTTPLPLLVDIDTGWGHEFCIQRTIKSMINAGVAAIHIEDQEPAKRCGHRPNKTIVTTAEMCDRIKAAVDARHDQSFVIMARTDALATEGVEASIERCQRYLEAGADMIFAEAITSSDEYSKFTSSIDAPVLSNMTEFGRSPLMTTADLEKVGVDMVLYPLSAFRAMSLAAEKTYAEIKNKGTQSGITDRMQTRERLYEVLDYYSFEEKIDSLSARKANDDE